MPPAITRPLLLALALLACRSSGPSDTGATSAASGPARLHAGGRRTCLVRGREIRCWGDASRGALGPAVSMSATAVPTSLPGIEGAVDIAFGEAHGCARLADGSVRCWGSNESGQLGVAGLTGDSAKPVAVPGVSGATHIAAGGVETCAVTASGLRCWGGARLAPPAGLQATAVAVGAQHACAIGRDRTVTCWGDDAHHQLGGGGKVKGLDAVDEIAAAGDTTCARRGGKVLCWGGNAAAQLGDPSMADRAEPRAIDGVDDATAIALGAQHACALRAGGQVVCWGGSDRGPFGYPASCPDGRRGVVGQAGTSGVVMSFCAAPVPVPGIDGAVAIAHGQGHACALDRRGAVRCWGGEGYAELGNREHGAAGSKEPIEVVFATPSPRAAPQAALAVEAADNWSCAILADHSVRCWGTSNLGQLGPQVKEQSARPVPIDGLGPVESLAMGPFHACAILAGGAVRCWGYNDAGQLGGTTTAKRAGPVAPVGLPAVSQISISSASSDTHTCALAQSGEVWCWGGNLSGQASPGDRRSASPTPARIAGVAGASQVAAGDGASCAVVEGAVFCWGVMHGPKDVRTRLAKPTRIAGLDKVVAVGLGSQAYCALLADRSVTCWGYLYDGSERRTIDFGGPVKAISMHPSSILAVLESGSAMTAWVAQEAAPTPIPLARPAQVSCTDDHCCALDENRRAVCWGDNGHGELGDPDQGFGGESPRPVPVAL